MQSKDLFTLKIKCKGKRRVGKANKRINLEKVYWSGLPFPSPE